MRNEATGPQLEPRRLSLVSSVLGNSQDGGRYSVAAVLVGLDRLAGPAAIVTYLLHVLHRFVNI